MPEQKTLSIDRWKAATFLCLLLCFAVPGHAADLTDDFLAARDAFSRGDAAGLGDYASRLKGSPLESYADFWQLSLVLNGADKSTVISFLDRYRGTLFAERLRKTWLKILAKSQDWQTFREQYPEVLTPDIELNCDWLRAKNALGDKDALREGKALWFSSKERPASCDPLFDALIDSKVISEKDIWIRLRMALDSGDVTLAREINARLPKRESMRESMLLAAYDNPFRYVKKHGRPHSRAEREIAIFAVLRISKSDPAQARDSWEKLDGSFGKSDRNFVKGKIAFQAALKHMPEALQWFDEAGALDDEELAWKTRAALREGDWNVVLSGIAAMSPEERSGEVWRYWKARALKSLGRIAEANALLADLSHEHDYYGQLALEEMGTVVTLPQDAYKAGEAEIEAVGKVPGIERALLLYSMGLRLDATREWIWAIRDFDDRQLLAAAELARRRGLYDRAINTADKTVRLNDFGLRYLAPYRDIMHEQTVQQGLDEAWVYGLVRQESRFVTGAKSGVGASGLMQLMPATAKWVASKLGLRNFHSSLVNQIETNISLGTYYLKHVLTLLGNQPVLASAAYNAGPVRARRWVGTAPMEGAIYIETIPYGETRDYVKKVMSNTAYYASAFGQDSVSLKERLGVVSSIGESP